MFNKNNFCHIASNNRNEKKAGVFVYKTTDNLETVATSGYFNDKIVDINLHDLIIHEWHNPADRTDVQRNLLCVVERTLDNVGTIVIKGQWEEDIEQYIEDTFVKKDGSSIMTGPLKFSAGSMRGAIAGGFNGLTFFKIDSEGNMTQIGSLSDTQFVPAADNTLDIGTNLRKVERIYLGKVNNGYDIDVPVTASADTLALKSQVDDAANSGEQLYDTGVWYAKMYAGTTPPSADNGTNYADFSQVDGDNNPIIAIYERQNGAWVQIQTITPPANHNGYMTITSKIWDIAEQAGQQGGLVLWAHNTKRFTPYPRIVSFDQANITNSTFSNSTITSSTFEGSATLSGNSTVTMPNNPSQQQIVNKDYVDNNSNPLKYVTDSVTEIPQDIKLELNNGTLTLKAGSKVYALDGTVYTIPNDLTNSYAASTAHSSWLLVKENGTLGDIWTTEPSGNITLGSKWITCNGTNYYLPICIATHKADGTSQTGWKNIDKIFNGSGLIGQYGFILPGVKGLIPNGINVDGTLKNLIMNNQTVRSRRILYGGYYTAIWLVGSSTMDVYNAMEYLESTTPPTQSNIKIWYNPNENIVKTRASSSQPWVKTDELVYAYVEGRDTYGILQSKNVFNAVDRNEYIINPGTVIAQQLPTSSNNYTWYRKYANGWVEQGGTFSGTGEETINIPVEMSDTNYTALISGYYSTAMEWEPVSIQRYSTTQIKIHKQDTDNGCWEIKGMAKQ